MMSTAAFICARRSSIKMLLGVFALIFLTQAHAWSELPKPKIQVLHPKGFRIGIEHSDGMTYASFQTNINEDLLFGEEGTYRGEAFHEEGGKWSYEEPHVKLNPQDKVNYWIFIAKSGIGYHQRGTYVIQDFDTIPSTRAPPDSNDIETETKEPSPNCEHLLLNMTQDLIRLQQEVHDLKKTNEQMERLLRRYPDAKTLKLSGRIPPDGEPAMTVKFIIREKLELNPDVIAAVRNEDTSIDFEVSSTIEKIGILEAAQDKLTGSSIVIS